MAWGANEFGQLGDGTLNGSDVPVAVSALSNVSAIAVGGASYALRDDGTVMAWGQRLWATRLRHTDWAYRMLPVELLQLDPS